MFEIRVVSPRAELTLEVPGSGPGILDAELMRGAEVTAYVGGAVPPVDGRKSVVVRPSPEYRGEGKT